MTIGFIGGSGIYESLPLTDVREVKISTPYGEPSAPVTVGTFEDEASETPAESREDGEAADAGREVAFLPRHGSEHGRSPTNLPYRANIYALKSVGVTHIFASNAVGSLKEDLPPGTLVVPDQIFDRTRNREMTFYGDGIVVHQPFTDPYSPELVSHLTEAARSVTDADVRKGGTYVCIEGPQYSTRAESQFFRAQGWDVVGMTAIPEAKLAREAEIAYATIAGVTDYDVWKEDHEVTLQEVLENAERNREAITAAVEEAIRTLPEDHVCDAHSALEGTINTPTDAIPEATRSRVEPLVGKYL